MVGGATRVICLAGQTREIRLAGGWNLGVPQTLKKKKKKKIGVCDIFFQAVEIIRPSFRFDDVDAVVNRNSLRKLLDFCHGRSQDSFRINLHIVHNTLIIEKCEKNAKEMVRGSVESGFGHNFERTFTQLPSGWKIAQATITFCDTAWET